MSAIQSAAKKRPSIRSKPAGVCIQLFTASIQKLEENVPTATRIAAPQCTIGGTSLRPNSSTPRNEASRKNAVRPS